MEIIYEHIFVFSYFHKHTNFVVQTMTFDNKEEIMQRILAIPQKEAEARGVPRSVFQGIKKRIRETGDVNLGTPGVRRLLQ